MNERIDELKRRIFSLSDAEKAELKSLMEKRNADPVRQASLTKAAAEAEMEYEAERKAACLANEAAKEKEEELLRYVSSLRGENVYLGNKWGEVPTWIIPDGIELGDSGGIGDCRLCGAALHVTNMKVYACKRGHFYDGSFDRMSMRSVVQWLRKPGWDKHAAGLEWAILGRSE